MTTQDFINTFDIFFNNLMSNRAPEVNVYEKSVLLTIAQEEIVKQIYENKFEGDEEKRRCLDVLLVHSEDENLMTPSDVIIGDGFRHYVAELPRDLWYIVFEGGRYEDDATCKGSALIPVVPTIHDYYHRDSRNPFRGPSANRILRLERPRGNAVELVSKYPMAAYILRYVRRPKPILLADFSMGEFKGLDIHIRGKQYTDAVQWIETEGQYLPNSDTESPCELNDLLHYEIVQRAVEYAIATYKGQ